MNKKKTEELFERYPKIFRQRILPMSETSMCWGFSCGDGWFNIIDCLCFTLQAHVDQLTVDWDLHKDKVEKPKWLLEPIPQVEATQVKEKFGGLKFYVDSSDDYILGAINFAEALSYKTCEDCGSRGETNKVGWISTLCVPCREERVEERNGLIQDRKQLKLF